MKKELKNTYFNPDFVRFDRIEAMARRERNKAINDLWRHLSTRLRAKSV